MHLIAHKKPLDSKLINCPTCQLSSHQQRDHSYKQAHCEFTAPFKFALDGEKVGNFTRSPSHT